MLAPQLSIHFLAVFNRPCKSNSGLPPREFELWRNNPYTATFELQLINALQNHRDDICVIVSPSDLSPNFMIFFNHDFSGDLTATLYGKNLICEQKKCDKFPPIIFLHDSNPTLCTDNRNPFCVHPTKCEFVGNDTLRSVSGETGCKFRCQCNDPSFCYSRIGLILDSAAVKPPGPLELCGIDI